MLIRPMVRMPPCPKVRARQSLEAKLASVRASANRNHKGRHPRILTGCLGIINQVHASCNNLRHILILFGNGKRDRTLAPFLVEVLLNQPKSPFPCLKKFLRVIPHNIIQLCLCTFTRHAHQMVESLIPFRAPAGLHARQE